MQTYTLFPYNPTQNFEMLFIEFDPGCQSSITIYISNYSYYYLGKNGLKNIHQVIAKTLLPWFVWRIVGFGLFYTPLTFASDYGESWLIAASRQIIIVMGILLAPLFKSRIFIKNLCAAGLIMAGVFCCRHII